ncbi:MAG: 4-hydroxy-tetrahydrodipicolinate reductase [Bacteroidota bacterium]
MKRSLNIGLLGYGKMGKAVEQEAVQRGHTIVVKIDQDNWDDLKGLSSAHVDAIIEFTHPASFDQNFRQVADLGIPLVSGTTGWYEQEATYRSILTEKEGAFLFASNFSIGVNILFKLNQRLAELMNAYDAYDPFIEEQHHRYKADGPSGTAHTLARDLMVKLDRKTVVSDASLRNRAPQAEELSVGFTRAGEIIGKHEVTYTSDIDRISITHEAYNRRGFAVGAVIAAEWLVGKKGFYEFSEVI